MWPLSTPQRPKQFIELVGEPFLVQALNRLDGMDGLGDAVVVTGVDHLAMVVEAAGGAGVDLHRIIVEPQGRNTAPAVIAAALVLEPDEIMVVLPADHLIAHRERFIEGVAVARRHAEAGALVTFGIEPTHPETGYGYIQKGDPDGPGFRVARFKEKPDADEAARLAADGAHLWNSGMFVFTAAAFLGEAERQVPDIVEGVRASLPDPGPERTQTITLGDGFSTVRSISIDHGVMEGAEDVRVVPLDAGWSDIGSWHALWEAGRQDGAGNVLIGDVVALGVRGSYVRSDSRTVAIAGVEDLVVVDTRDVVLIVAREQAQLVRDLAALGDQGRDAD